MRLEVVKIRETVANRCYYTLVNVRKTINT